MRIVSLGAASLAVAAVLAGCGGSGGKGTTSTATHAFSQAADVTYERSYTDCGSVAPSDLATRYHVKNQKDLIAEAVAKYWAKQAHGGADAVEAGKEGCNDGFKIAGR